MRFALLIFVFALSGCSAIDSLIFHPIHKVWSDREAEKAWRERTRTNSPAK